MAKEKHQLSQFEFFCFVSLLLVLFVILNSLTKDVFFRFKYSNPVVTSTSQKQLDTSKEPIQIEMNEVGFHKIDGEKGSHAVQLMAKYSITCMVVAVNKNLWFRDILRNNFDDVALIDFGMVWGELADRELLENNFKFKSSKTLGEARRLSFQWNGNVGKSSDYITSHVAHTHLIPANTNIMGALLKVRKYDVIKLNGYLVDLYNPKTSQVYAMTSLSRSDSNATSRGYNKGGGACEILYVTSVQLGDKVYK